MPDQMNSGVDKVATPVVQPKAVPSNGTATVTVGCKLPSGFVLHLYKMEPFHEAVFGGGVRETTIARRLPGEWILNGYGEKHGELGKIIRNRHQISGGFGLTPGVPL